MSPQKILPIFWYLTYSFYRGIVKGEGETGLPTLLL